MHEGSDMYKSFSNYYDLFFENHNKQYKPYISFINKKIKKFIPKAKSILEIGCGTGNVLGNFVNKFELYGIDVSKEMLDKAKIKVPTGKFYNMDIREFQMTKKFDCIIGGG